MKLQTLILTATLIPGLVFAKTTHINQNAKPFEVTKHWIKEEKTLKNDNIHIFGTLSTIDSTLKPNSRVMQFLLTDNNEILFFTHKNTQKIKHLSNNPFASITLWLDKNKKQININGSTYLVARDKLTQYWNNMPKWMQLRFIASDHISEIQNKDILKSKVKELKHKHSDSNVPLPDEFVGYRFSPNKYTFYKVNTGKFADKFVATNDSGSWQIKQYQP